VLVDLGDDLIIFTGMNYLFTLIDIPEDIDNYSEPGDAILFTSASDPNAHYYYTQSITTYYIDDQAYTGSNSSVIPRFAVV